MRAEMFWSTGKNEVCESDIRFRSTLRTRTVLWCICLLMFYNLRMLQFFWNTGNAHANKYVNRIAVFWVHITTFRIWNWIRFVPIGACKHIYCFKSSSPKNKITVIYLSSFQSKPEWLLFTGNLNFWVKPCSYHCAFSLLRWSDPHPCSLCAHVPAPFPFWRSYLATPLQWHCSRWACIKFHHSG